MNYTLDNRPTLRKNGQMMFDFNVTFPIGLEEISWAIGNYLDMNVNTNADKITRAAVLEAVAQGLQQNGLNDFYYGDPVFDEELCNKVAEKLFPELKKK